MTDRERIAHLRKLREGVTPGPWSKHAPNWPTAYMIVAPSRGENFPVAVGCNSADAEYLAALDPDTLGWLLDLAERRLGKARSRTLPNGYVLRVWGCPICGAQLDDADDLGPESTDAECNAEPECNVCCAPMVVLR